VRSEGAARGVRIAPLNHLHGCGRVADVEREGGCGGPFRHARAFVITRSWRKELGRRPVAAMNARGAVSPYRRDR